MVNGRNLFNLILLVIMLIMVVLSFEYNSKARLFPMTVGLLTFLMLLWQFLIDLFPALQQKFSNKGAGDNADQKVEGEDTGEQNKLTERKSWVVATQCMIAMLAFTILLKYISYLIAVPIFLVLFIWLVGKAKFIHAFSISLVMSGFMYVLFDLVLQARI